MTNPKNKMKEEVSLPPFNNFTMLPNALLHEFHSGNLTALDIITYLYLAAHNPDNCIVGNDSVRGFLGAKNIRTAKRYIKKLTKSGHIQRIRRKNKSSRTAFQTRWIKGKGLLFKGQFQVAPEKGQKATSPASAEKQGHNPTSKTMADLEKEKLERYQLMIEKAEAAKAAQAAGLGEDEQPF